MHEMGGMRELEQTLIRTLMAEFARLHLILGEDLAKSLSALRSPRTELPIGVPEDDRGTLLDTIGSHQQDMRSHPGPWNPRGSRVPASYARAGHGPASRGYFLPRDPGQVDWEAQLDTSRCSRPTHLS